MKIIIILVVTDVFSTRIFHQNFNVNHEKCKTFNFLSKNFKKCSKIIQKKISRKKNNLKKGKKKMKKKKVKKNDKKKYFLQICSHQTQTV